MVGTLGIGGKLARITHDVRRCYGSDAEHGDA